MGILDDIWYASWETIKSQALDIIDTLFLSPVKRNIVAKVIDPKQFVKAQRLLSARLLSTQAKDGAFLDGPASIGYAKFAIRK